MSDKRHYILVHETARKLAKACIDNTPTGYHVRIEPPTRTLEANARMWALLSEVSAQVIWHGRKLTSDEWKIVFSAALKQQEVLPGINGGFVAMGQSTSKMSKKEMCELQTLIEAFGAEHGVRFQDERIAANG